jgi:hypothetical protein
MKSLIFICFLALPYFGYTQSIDNFKIEKGLYEVLIIENHHTKKIKGGEVIHSISSPEKTTFMSISNSSVSFVYLPDKIIEFF